MRRWSAALACAVAVTLLAGCVTPPEGVDGDLTDSWPAMPAARQFRPEPGTCHTALQQTGAEEAYAPVSCTEQHLAETVVVADLGGAGALTNPEAGRARAYADCTRRTSALLGADWRTGWLSLRPVLPSRQGWSGGARWFRCDLAQTSPLDGEMVNRFGSLRGTLRPGGGIRMTCVDPTVKHDRVTSLRPVPCDHSHAAEFAGLWNAPVRSTGSLTTARLSKGCHATIATFAGIPNDRAIGSRVGWFSFGPSKTAWGLGDRAIRCFLWLNGEKMRGSYRKAGKTKLKIHYAG